MWSIGLERDGARVRDRKNQEESTTKKGLYNGTVRMKSALLESPRTLSAVSVIDSTTLCKKKQARGNPYFGSPGSRKFAESHQKVSINSQWAPKGPQNSSGISKMQYIREEEQKGKNRQALSRFPVISRQSEVSCRP